MLQHMMWMGWLLIVTVYTDDCIRFKQYTCFHSLLHFIFVVVVVCFCFVVDVVLFFFGNIFECLCFLIWLFQSFRSLCDQLTIFCDFDAICLLISLCLFFVRCEVLQLFPPHTMLFATQPPPPPPTHTCFDFENQLLPLFTYVFE